MSRIRFSQAASILCLLLSASLMARAQFKEIGPPPLSREVARKQIRSMLQQVDASNEKQTVKALADLAVWYRDLLDEELIGAWRGDGRVNLPEVIENLADAPVAAGVVELSWREKRQTAFTPAYAPMLGHLMARYSESAKPFLDDLLLPASTGGRMPELSHGEAEAVCRILLDMPDVGNWRKDALTILPHYRAAAESLLNGDRQRGDKGKSDAAEIWLSEIRKADPSFMSKGSIPPASTGGDVIQVLSGTYGQNCGQPKGNQTQNLAEACNGKLECSYRIYGVIIGDPAPACDKDYRAEYQCGGGPLFAFAGAPAGMGEPIVLSCAVPGSTHTSAPTSQSKPASGLGTMGPDGIYKIGNGVSPPDPIKTVGVGWSDVALKLRPVGRSVVGFVIQPDGTARDFQVQVAVGYGLDEKHIEALRQWRFRPAMKDGFAVPVRAADECSFGDKTGAAWLSGPMTFVPQVGVTPPVVRDGSMPKPGQEISNESAVLGFTVDEKGSVRNVHAISGSSAASGLLSRSLATWKFRPAMKGNVAVEADGTVRFLKGQGDGSPNVPQNPKVDAPGAGNDAFSALTIDMLTGSYRRDPVENPWHHGRIDKDPLRWTNNAGVSWRLTPDLANGRLLTGPDNPYYKTSGTQEYHVRLSRGPVPIVEGIQFGPLPNEFYRRVDGRPGADAGPVRDIVNDKDGLTYIWIPPGTFTMGCSPGDTECGAGENPPHLERVEHGFRLGQTEVTQAAYQRVTGSNPSAHKGDQLPVESLTWNDAADYCAAIGGRLPTELEWEYAARAGTTTARYGALDDVAWHSGNSGGTSHPVGQKLPNEFGLYDMLGNVWEFVQDSQPGSQTKTLRGGSWAVDPRNARASALGFGAPSARFGGRGFRCALGGNVPADAAAARQSSAGFAGVVSNVGNGVSPPQVVRKFDPEYSDEARKAKYSGTVLLELVVDTNGRPQDIRVVRSLGLGLDEKAMEAVKKWQFQPGMQDGKPVNVKARIELIFRIK
jgi:TonB family protein